MKAKYWKLGILVFSFFCIIFELLLLIKSFSPNIEIGSVSDWFSTIFNGVVACTAVLAFSKAKDFFKEKLTEEDIELWFQINQSVASIASSVTILWILYERMITQWQETDDIVFLKYNYLDFLHHLNDFTAQLHKLDEFSYRLDARNKPYEKRDLLDKLRKNLHEFNSVVVYKVHSITNIFNYSRSDHGYPKNIKDGFIEDAKKNISAPLALNEKLQSTYNILREFGIDNHHLN